MFKTPLKPRECWSSGVSQRPVPAALAQPSSRWSSRLAFELPLPGQFHLFEPLLVPLSSPVEYIHCGICPLKFRNALKWQKQSQRVSFTLKYSISLCAFMLHTSFIKPLMLWSNNCTNQSNYFYSWP